MNLKILHKRVMLGLSERWLNDPVIRAELLAHILGAALHAALQEVHDDLAEQQSVRARIEAAIAALSKLIAQLDSDHDRMARALHYFLEALAEAEKDPAAAEVYRNLKALLFPDGLSIVQSSYLEEAGAIEELQRRVTPEVLAQLERIRVGRHTLADLYRAWVDAGRQLGQQVHERARLKASIASEGTTAAKAHVVPVRQKWIRTVHMLIDAIDMLPLSQTARENILAPLEQSIADALRGKGTDETGDGDMDDVGDDDLDDVPGDLPGNEPTVPDMATTPASA